MPQTPDALGVTVELSWPDASAVPEKVGVTPSRVVRRGHRASISRVYLDGRGNHRVIRLKSSLDDLDCVGTLLWQDKDGKDRKLTWDEEECPREDSGGILGAAPPQHTRSAVRRRPTLREWLIPAAHAQMTEDAAPTAPELIPMLSDSSLDGSRTSTNTHYERSGKGAGRSREKMQRCGPRF